MGAGVGDAAGHDIFTQDARFLLSFWFERRKKSSPSLSCVVTVSCWPTALGDEIFHAAFSFRWLSLSETSSYPHTVPHRPVSSRSPAPCCEWSRQILSDTLPPRSQGSRFIHISYLLHILDKCMLGKSQLIIYIYTNVTKRRINKLLVLKYLKFHRLTDGPH